MQRALNRMDSDPFHVITTSEPCPPRIVCWRCWVVCGEQKPFAAHVPSQHQGPRQQLRDSIHA